MIIPIRMSFALMITLCCFSTMVSAESASDLINGKFEASSRKVRVAIAQDLLKRVQSLDSFVPTPKPSEVEWVERERRELARTGTSNEYDNRARNVFTSPEYFNQKLKFNLLNIMANLENITSSVSIEKEMVFWMVASFYLTDRSSFDDAVRSLIDAGRMPRDLESKVLILTPNLGYGYWLDVYGRGIVEYIIIPHLSKQSQQKH